MSDTQLGFAILVTMFNLPVAILASAYTWMTAVTYRRRKDSRALRGFVVACGLLAAVLAIYFRSIGEVLVDETPDRLPGVLGFLIFTCRVVLLTALVIGCIAWWRRER